MSLKHTGGSLIPAPPDLRGDLEEVKLTLNTYISDLYENLTKALDDIYNDFSKGSSRHQVFTSTIVATDMDNGEIQVENVGGVRKLVTYIGGTKFSVTLS